MDPTITDACNTLGTAWGGITTAVTSAAALAAMLPKAGENVSATIKLARSILDILAFNFGSAKNK